ncbi:MAG TPA: dual specificity protein phosphatase family protein [Actinomycetota bacterium]
MDVTNRKRQGVNAIIPGLLYQRGHFLTWPHERKMTMLEELGISVVINLWHRVDSDLSQDIPGTFYINAPMSPSAMPRDARSLLDFAGKLLAAGHVTLVHCEAGKGRSAWFATRLMAERLGISKAEAWQIVQQAVPGNSVHGPLLRDLTEE